MYEYEYVRVENRDFMGAEFKGYQDIIDERARQGWRFVCCIPTIFIKVLESFDLVFEREAPAQPLGDPAPGSGPADR